jgi:hypothetical protein
MHRTPRNFTKKQPELTPCKSKYSYEQFVSPKRSRQDSALEECRHRKRTRTFASSSLDTGLCRLLISTQTSKFETPLRQRRCFTPPAPRKTKLSSIDQDFFLAPRKLYANYPVFDSRKVVDLQIVTNLLQSFVLVADRTYVGLDECIEYIKKKSKYPRTRRRVVNILLELGQKSQNFINVESERIFVSEKQAEITFRLLQNLI